MPVKRKCLFFEINIVVSARLSRRRATSFKAHVLPILGLAKIAVTPLTRAQPFRCFTSGSQLNNLYRLSSKSDIFINDYFPYLA
jgi:hypothetical protein